MPYGPCCVCGATNYPSSYGGQYICPSCDCGNTIKIGNKIYQRVGTEGNINIKEGE